MEKIILEGVVECKKEDGGQALIAEVGDVVGNKDSEFFVRLQSWDENREHPEMNSFKGKKVRVTVEVIEE
jgi:hypothetical protein